MTLPPLTIHGTPVDPSLWYWARGKKFGQVICVGRVQTNPSDGQWLFWFGDTAYQIDDLDLALCDDLPPEEWEPLQTNAGDPVR